MICMAAVVQFLKIIICDPDLQYHTGSCVRLDYDQYHISELYAGIL